MYHYLSLTIKYADALQITRQGRCPRIVIVNKQLILNGSLTQGTQNDIYELYYK
jgi:hypothetical protein